MSPRKTCLLRRGLLVSSSAGLTLSLLTASQARPNRAHRRATLRQQPQTAPASTASLTLQARERTARVALERGRQLEAQGIPSLAEAQFQSAVDTLPASVDMNRELARFYGRNGHWDGAAETWRTVLAMSPHHSDAEASSQLLRAQNQMLAMTASPVVARNDFAPGTENVAQVGTLLDGGDSEFTSTRVLAQAAPPAAMAGGTAPAPAAPQVAAPAAAASAVAAASAAAPPPVAAGPEVSAPLAPAAPPAASSTAAMAATAPPVVPLTPPLPAAAPAPAPVEDAAPAPAPIPVPAPAPAAPPLASAPIAALPYQPPLWKKTRVSRAQAAKAWPLVNQAGRAISARQVTRALALYKQAYAIDPTNQYAGPGVATAYVILGRFDEAAATYRGLLAYKPDFVPYLRGLADALSYGKHYREALGVNNRILAHNGRDFGASFSNAQIYTFVGNYAPADRAFSIATSVRPTDPDVLAAWGESLSYRQDPRAVGTLKKAQAMRPGFVRAQLGLGNYYSYTGDFAEAVPQYQAVLNHDSHNVAALIGLGDALAFTGQPSQAISYYRLALAVEPRNTNAHLGLGRALVYSGRSEEGAAQLRIALAARPGDVQALDALAMAQTDTSPKAAEATYLDLIARQTNPLDRAKSLAALGDLRGRSNDFAGAGQAYSQAVSLAPGDSKIALSYAQLLVSQTQYEQAKPLVDGVASAHPNNAQALALQAIIESKIGDPSKAQAMADRLAQVTPASPEEALQLSDALRSTGNLVASRTVLEKAISTAKTPATQLKLADAIRDSGDYPAAGQLYTQILANDPENSVVRLNLAEVLIYQKDLGAANQQIQTVLKADPNNVQAKVLQATVALRGDTVESRSDAERQATAILAQNPDNPKAQVILGEVMTSRKKFADAIGQFKSAVAADPNNLEARLGLARNLYYSRDVENSITEYRELIRRTPTDTLPKLELAQIFLDRNRFSDAEGLYNEVLTLRRSGSLLSKPSALLDGRIVTRSLAKVSPLSDINALSRFQPAPVKRPALARRVLLAQLAPSTSATVSGAPAPSTPTSSSNIAAGAAGAPVSGGSLNPSSIGAAPTSPAAPVPAAPSSNFLSPGAPLPVAQPTGSTGLAGLADQASADEVAALRGLGEIRRRQNRYTEAADYFNQALDVEPTDAGARLGLAQSLRGQLKYVEALQQVDRVLSTDAANLQGRVLRAQLLGDTGKPQQAQDELDALVTSLPEDAPVETYQTLAQAFNSLGNYGASLQLLDAAKTAYPNEPAIPRLKGETLTFAKKYPEAIALYDQIIAADPKDTDALIGKARVYNYSNRLPEAEAQYKMVLDVQPDNYQATVEFADIESRKANYPESIRLYQAAISSNPKDLAARVELARVQRYAGLSADSEATLNAVLDLDPNNATAYTERGVLRGQLGSYTTAEADLNKALQIAPTDLNAQLGLAEVQGYAGQYPESIKGFRAVLARDPQNAKARTELGLVLSYSGDYADALKELDIALKQNPGDADVQIARGEVLARSGRTKDAVDTYNAVLAADPNNRRATQGLADAYVFGGEFDKAVKVYDRLILQDPTSANYKIQRARALGYGGHYREAVASLRQVVAADPTNMTARLALAEAGTNSGNAGMRNAAIAEYRSILVAAPDNIPARIGLARALSYRGDYKEATSNLNQVLAANPNNTDARYALAETQRFEGKPYDAKGNYEAVLAATPNDRQAKAGLAAVRHDTANILTGGGSYYHDSNGVNLHSYNAGVVFNTRALTFGVIADRGKFKQGAVERDRNAFSVLLAKNFGPIQSRLVLTQLKYTGVSSKTLYDFSLNRPSGDRKRVYVGAARRDIFESDGAVSAGITAQTYTAGFAQPLGDHFDLEGQATYYRYSDDNHRITLAPALYFRFKPTNPSLRVGLGYTFDDTGSLRTIYYTPQNFNATAVLADYVVNSGPTRYGIFGAKSLTNATGSGGATNRPADTLFGFINHDLTQSLEVFANGGIVRSDNFKSDQVTGGVNLRF